MPRKTIKNIHKGQNMEYLAEVDKKTAEKMRKELVGKPVLEIYKNGEEFETRMTACLTIKEAMMLYKIMHRLMEKQGRMLEDAFKSAGLDMKKAERMMDSNLKMETCKGSCNNKQMPEETEKEKKVKQNYIG